MGEAEECSHGEDFLFFAAVSEHESQVRGYIFQLPVYTAKKLISDCFMVLYGDYGFFQLTLEGCKVYPLSFGKICRYICWYAGFHCLLVGGVVSG